MVVKLIGNVNGADVIFSRCGNGDEWEVTVPASLNGTYILEMTAHDAAGNTAYWARYILVVDLASLRVTLRACPYRANLCPAPYRAILMNGGGCG